MNEYSDIKFVLNDDGDLVASMTWGPYTFTEPVPSEYDDWSRPMQFQYLSTKIIPRLTYLVRKAKEITIAQDVRIN